MTDLPPSPDQPAAAADPVQPQVPARREPWHQLDTETESAYAHFLGYLHMERGRRSLRGLATQRGVHVSTLADLSAQHQWVARVQTHDRHLDEIEEVEFEAERRRIARAAARAAGNALDAATLAIRAGVMGLQQYAKAGTVDAHGIARDESGAPVYRLDADQSLAAVRAGTRAAVAAHQLVADRVKPGDTPDGVDVEEVAFGLTVFDLAQSLMDLVSGPPPPGGVQADPDVIDVPATDSAT